jgi:NAD(P)-dependent dehydrogenase (short-subunit alcohol dehydrogenase family)
VDDYSLDATARSWVFQALRDITGKRIGDDPAAWRNWAAVTYHGLSETMTLTGKLTGKGALITGGGSGIGLAIAQSFAGEGAAVVIAGRSPERLDAALAEAGSLASHIAARPADVSSREQVRELVAWSEDHLAGIDILVNNAGINVKHRALAELSVEDWEKVIEINLNGSFYCIHEVLPRMRERNSGLIINISSTAGIRVSEIAGPGYSVSKHGMSALSLATGMEEREHGIRSCLICPGEVNAPILDHRPVPVPEEKRRQILQPEDIAAAALFVATLPPRATVPQLVITPSHARFV